MEKPSEKKKKDPIEAMKAKLRDAEHLARLARLAPPYSAALLKALEKAKEPKRSAK